MVVLWIVMKKPKNKKCAVCDTQFDIPAKYSLKQAVARKYCTIKCGATDRDHSQYKSGWKHTEEAKQKISKRFFGKFRSESYGAIHNWLLKHFSKGACEFCGGRRFVEFALKKGFEHKHKRENYLLLCSSCHKKYDYTKERRERLSKSLIGRKIAWKDKISKANKGRVFTEEQRIARSKVAKIQSKNRVRNHLGQYA